ncbi:hypothetical protein PILCRDRAFT_443111 [Piloderma croceum F 1598]|uniref:Aminoglycoside phosphotransferase domain-containing protein n=1 Tax=Piloderma croceum (strain F 1598) TaxID=765440 RepID=A0A0C3BAU7_PILCF|nr:hypothetical protein PILCRDRAFT_443111 [Piloderma croceum F 1598]
MSNDRDSANSIPLISLQEISAILKTHIAPVVTATAFVRIPSGSHEVYKVTDSGNAQYILKLGARMWPQKIESEVATLTYFRNHTQIPVPTIRGYRVGNWQTDYVLVDFIEGQKLAFLWSHLSQPEQISYVKQVASIYAELDRTSFTSIGSLRLGGAVGSLDSLDTLTGPDGLLVGTSLGPYESLQAFWRGQLHHSIEQLASDPLLADNADLHQDLYCWAEHWAQKAPEPDAYSLFGIECIKTNDIIVRDGRIVAVVDLENFQINAPEFLKLHSPLHFDGEMLQVFNEECEKLGVRAWVKTDSASKARYDYCLRSTLIMQNIVPGDYNLYLRSNDLVGLKVRLAEARDALLSTLNEGA